MCDVRKISISISTRSNPTKTRACAARHFAAMPNKRQITRYVTRFELLIPRRVEITRHGHERVGSLLGSLLNKQRQSYRPGTLFSILFSNDRTYSNCAGKTSNNTDELLCIVTNLSNTFFFHRVG